MSNRLSKEKSLYLRQHAENPVNWWPWCPEALEAAQAENKPLLVSIGYSSCHWCHVMAHESFENDYIAEIMNKHFICIKVDREERPDLDQVYMEAVQMITQQGGWPLNVFCLPDGRPFFGGTYFPADDKRPGHIPWPQLLMRIANHYERNPDELAENAKAIVHNLEHSNLPPQITGTQKTPLKENLLKAAKQVSDQADPIAGGFGNAPKFPSSMSIDFLLSIGNTQACAEDKTLLHQTQKVATQSLDAMAFGGIFDQFGGGFYRYTVDRDWKIPHFEKMLYDNALLISTYSKAYLDFKSPLYKRVIEKTIGWLTREMLLKEGGFASSIDADSEGEEGKYYTWNPEQIKAALSDEKEASQFAEAFDITESGNFENGFSNPNFPPKNFQALNEWENTCEKLLNIRQKRTPPSKDNKVLTAWNALTIKGLVESGFALKKPEWIRLAQETADWLWDHAFDSNRGLTAVIYENQASELPATLNDYAFFARSLLSVAGKIDLIDPSESKKYISRAAQLTEILLRDFEDSENSGYFFSAKEAKDLPVRKKDWFDNAIPSGNSLLLENFYLLYLITGEKKWQNAYGNILPSYEAWVEKLPTAVPMAMTGITLNETEIPIIKVSNQPLLEEIHTHLLTRKSRETLIFFDETLPEPTQLCIGTQCLPNEPTLQQLIEKV